MTHPPSLDIRDLGPPAAEGLLRLRRLAAFGQELASVQRRAPIAELLVRHVREAFHPVECAVAHLTREVDVPSLNYTWPAAGADRGPLLDLAMRQGPLLVAERVDEALRLAGLPPAVDGAGSWLLVPLVARGQSIGALAIRGTEGQYGPMDLAFAEALAAQACIALEGARLVDIHDKGRRSWQQVVDAIAPALCVVDATGSIRRANKAFAALVATPFAALIGRPWRTFVPPEWLPELERILQAQSGEESLELAIGDRTYAVSAVAIGGSDPSISVLLFDDQTDRRRLQDQLVQSEKMSAIGQLIAGIAHDLNNPLASVVGFAEFLSELPDVPATLRDPLTVIREEAERASGIVKNLLSFARKQDRQRRPTAIRPLLDATFVLLRNQLMATQVEARIEVEPDLPLLNLDANQIQQVFVNLIHNAAQAIASTGRPGTVTVRARRWLDGVAVDVIDDGPGMSEALAAQVFEPFFTTKPEGQGTGLGLSISHGIVREHGGRIVLCTEEGRGSTFTVYLPTASTEHTCEPAPHTQVPATSLRVLVVDDEPHILHYMRATLEAWGHQVAVALDGEAALQHVLEESFDLIITDVRMPKVGGREFHEELRRLRPDQAERLIFSTGDTVRGDTLAFLESLGKPYLHKPFSLAELREVLGAGIGS